jgi:hypothetical protein
MRVRNGYGSWVLPTEVCFAIPGFAGNATESEKSMMSRTVLRQKMQGVSTTSGLTASDTFKGNDRRHSVQVSTT